MPYANDYPCAVEDCIRPKRNKLYCTTHHVRWKKWGDPLGNAPHGNNLKFTYCTVEGCANKHSAQGLCATHYSRVRIVGDANIVRKKQPKELRTITHEGYINIYSPNHPFVNRTNKMLEHRLVMEQMIGRYLEKHENVHHKNGNRSDNRPENLELWSVSQPSGQRIEDKVRYALEILSLYAPELIARKSVA